MKGQESWISESWENVETRYRIREVILDKKTDFQHLQIVETYEYGKMLLLDGIVQTTERDEFIYHEMMVHVPMMSHPGPRKVLVIGGGDGGILREVFQYPSIKKCTVVEIDPVVIDLCKEYLPGISRGAFEDDRTELVIMDGAAYLEGTDEKFDVVIVDSPDPVGPARVLFSEKFYSDIHRAMDQEGIMVRQTGSTHLQAHEQKESYLLLRGIFVHTVFYVYTVPTYVGGLFSTAFCSDRIDPLNLTAEELREKLDQSPIKTSYYNPGIHVGAFDIPGFLKGSLQ